MSDKIGAASLLQLANLTRALVDAGIKVDRAEQAVKDAKEQQRVLSEETIPGVLQELGVSEIKLDTGEKLSVKQDVYASIPKDGKVEAFGWLEQHGFGGMIKTDVTAVFGRDELETAVALNDKLVADGMQTEFNQTVAPQTLKAWLREQLAAGADVPLTIFGARPVWVTKITKK